MVILKIRNNRDEFFNVAFEEETDANEFERFLNEAKFVTVTESYTVPIIEIPAENECDHMWEYWWNHETKATDRKCLRKECGCIQTSVDIPKWNPS